MFQFSAEEATALRSQFVTLEKRARLLPKVPPAGSLGFPFTVLKKQLRFRIKSRPAIVEEPPNTVLVTSCFYNSFQNAEVENVRF